MPENTGAGSPANPFRRRLTNRWLLLLVGGVCSIGTGSLLGGLLILWFSDRVALSPSATYTAFEWGQAYVDILFGVGILLLGLGWTLDEWTRQLAQYSTASPAGTAIRARSLLVILGTLVATGGQFLAFTILVSDLDGVRTIANALGPGWSVGLPDFLIGVGLLLAGAGIVALWLGRRKAARSA
jgi:hypothetical protein